MSIIRCFIAIFITATLVGGCARSAANMAATQPEARDLTILHKGVHRDKVIARLGAPESSTPHGDMTVDVYKFVQGYSAGARTARVFTHSTLSIATLGLWEVAGTAIEGYARGTEVSVRAIYDPKSQLETYEILDGKDAVDDEIVSAGHVTTAPPATRSAPPGPPSSGVPAQPAPPMPLPAATPDAGTQLATMAETN